MFYLNSKLDMQIKTKRRCHFIIHQGGKNVKTIIIETGEVMD